LDLIFKSPFEMVFVVSQKIVPNEHVLIIFTLAFIHMNFMSNHFKIPTWHPSWQMTLATFDIGFDLVGLGDFIGDWTLIVNNYNIEI
jgi:hypothetical protein